MSLTTTMLGTIAAAGLTLLAATPDPSSVEVTGQRWRALNPEPAVVQANRWAQQRTVELEVQPDGIVVRGRWEIRATAPGFFADQLLPTDAHIRKATWNGKPASIWTTSAGLFVAGRVKERSTLVLEAFIPATNGRRAFALLGATQGSLKLNSEEPLRVNATDGSVVFFSDGRYRTGASAIELVAKPSETNSDGTLVFAEAGVGLTIGDGEIAGKARVRWSVRRGSTQRVELDVVGVGTDLELEGPNVAGWKRDGDRVTVDLKSPETGRVDAELSWTTSLARSAQQTLPLATVVPREVFRVDATLQVARDGDVDVVPDLIGWDPVRGTTLPEYGKGLVSGTPTATYRKAAGATDAATLDLFRFEPVEGPPVLVEIADITVAATTEGRHLMLARYEVLNERAGFLDITPPEGARLVGVWVTGKEARAHAVGRKLRVPLRRSLETVQGLLTFPVVVAFIDQGDPWGRTVDREIALPTVDAPVNVERVTLRLPRSHRSMLDPSDDGVVEAFTRGQGVAYGLSDPDAVAQADAAYGEALGAWQRNDFDGAKGKLEELERSGAKSKNQAGLASNVDLVLRPDDAPAPAPQPSSGRDSGVGRTVSTPVRKTVDKKDTIVTRRIRARARARSSGRREKQRRFKKKAKSLKDAGRYKEAEATYQQAASETEELRRLEDDDAAVYHFEADEIDSELEGLRQEAKNREQLESSSQRDSAEHAPFNRLALDPDVPVSDPQPPAIAPIAMPRGGEQVFYQYLLVGPSADRAVPIKARRKRTHNRPRRRPR